MSNVLVSKQVVVLHASLANPLSLLIAPCSLLFDFSYRLL